MSEELLPCLNCRSVHTRGQLVCDVCRKPLPQSICPAPAASDAEVATAKIKELVFCKYGSVEECPSCRTKAENLASEFARIRRDERERAERICEAFLRDINQHPTQKVGVRRVLAVIRAAGAGHEKKDEGSAIRRG
jgi:hypothetical protein